MVQFLITICVLLALASGTNADTGTAGDAIETTGSGRINWTIGEIYATGIGAPPSLTANAAQARAMAERAAFVVALRNLLEAVKGIRVDSETVVENFMVKSDVIKTRVDGIVKGARTVKTQYMSDGSVEVTVAMPFKGGLMDAVVPESFGRPAGMPPVRPVPMPQRPSDSRPPVPQPVKPSEPARPEQPKPIIPAPAVPEKKAEPSKPLSSQTGTMLEKKPEPMKQPEPSTPPTPTGEGPTVAFKGGIATGIVLDGRGLGLRPALLPKIVDTQGQEIYVGQVATRTNAVEQGVAGYAKDVNAAANNFRVTDNPAVIKGLRAAGSARTDIVVSQADAQTLRQLSSQGDFLQYCRVIIVY